MNDVKVPKHWSQVATDILTEIFPQSRSSGFLKKMKGVPLWLQKSEADTVKMKDFPERERYTSEKIRQKF